MISLKQLISRLPHEKRVWAEKAFAEDPELAERFCNSVERKIIAIRRKDGEELVRIQKHEEEILEEMINKSQK